MNTIELTSKQATIVANLMCDLPGIVQITQAPSGRVHLTFTHDSFAVDDEGRITKFS